MIDVREIEKKIEQVREIRDTLGDEPEVDEVIIGELESGIKELKVDKAFAMGRFLLKGIIFLRIMYALDFILPNGTELFFKSVVIIITLILASQLIKEEYEITSETDYLIDLENEYYDIIDGIEEDENAKGR